jgi:hypothetical protein
MFRPTTIIRELALRLAKVIFMLKHSVELRRYVLGRGVATCPGTACVLCAVQSESLYIHFPQLIFLHHLAIAVWTCSASSKFKFRNFNCDHEVCFHCPA